jgi:hypothetical protein
MTATETNAPIPLPLAGAGKAPYHAWLDRRFPDGELDYNPPVSEFLATEALRNAWTSHVPDGSAPTDLRIDVYLRRGWNGDAGTLDIGNAAVTGEKAPRGWTPESLALLCDAVSEVEACASAAGYVRMAVSGADDGAREVYASMGYAPAPDALPGTGDLTKPLA